MTRRGVHRWATRAFCRGTIAKTFRSAQTNRCCVELRVPTRLGTHLLRWTQGASWGECVRRIEEHFLFREAPPEAWGFQSQLLVHERKDEIALRLLGGAWPLTAAVRFNDSIWLSDEKLALTGESDLGSASLCQRSFPC